MAASSVVVLGGAGFIGSHFVDYLLENTEHHVVNVDCLTYAANKEYATMIHPRYTFIKGNITNYKLLRHIFLNYKPDYIVNFAAESHVTRSIESPHNFINTNINGVYSILRAYMDYRIGRLHHVSTDEVYGSLNIGDAPFTESSPYNPSTPYAATKAAAEQLVLAWHKTYGLNITMSSSSNNYGKRQHEEKFIPIVLNKILSNEPVPLHGDGKHIRDWIHVRDHVDAIYTILESGVAGEKYNIGARNEISNVELVSMLSSNLGITPTIEYVADRSANDIRYATNPSKLEALGWSPKHNIKDWDLQS